MSHADYSQRAEDHQSLLVLLKSVGPHKTKSYNKIFDRISRVTCVRMQDAKRNVFLRYKKNVPQTNNEWGDYQCHRKVLGLLCIGKCTSDSDLLNIQANFDSLKEGYKSTLYDSRCMVFGNSTQQTRPDFIVYPSFDDCQKLEDHVKEFAAAVFWVLESKRLDKSNDKGDKAPLLMAPFEKKDFVGIDTESRNYKKRIQGRMRKHIGDLCLQATMTNDAFIHYQSAADTLKSANDWLWFAGALEGMCSASVIMLYPQKPTTLTRNLTFHGSPTRVQNIRTKASSYTANGFSDGLDGKPPKHCLSADDIIDKYKETIVQYSKYKHAGIIEMETSIKATRALIQQNKFLEASDFLQNVVYINLQLSDEDKIQRYSTLSVLYEEIGFKRKCSFFKRVAAMQCVAPQNPYPGWSTCHNLLLKALLGYRLSLDQRENSMMSGWPVIQLRILNELVFTAKKMGNPALAVRHMSFLLHTMFDHMTQGERKEMCAVLENYTSKCAGTPTPLALENGNIISAVQFTRFPTIKSFKALNLVSHLRPHHHSASNKKNAAITNSPFIYSPIQPSSHDRNVPSTKLDFKWVEGDTCEVLLQVYNPLPFELKVENMGLLTEDVEFDPIPASFALPAESGPYPLSIHGSPKGTGTLKIIGYITHCLGVRSHCRLRDVPTICESFYEVDVVAALPQLLVHTSLPQSAAIKATPASSGAMLASATVNLFAGQSHECEITLHNCGQVPVQSVIIHLDSSKSKDISDSVMFSWSKENIETQLPIQPGNNLTFTLYIKAMADFITSDAVLDEEDSPYSPYLLPEFKSMSLKSNNSDVKSIQSLEALQGILCIKYSGGEGHVEGYYRVALVGIQIIIQPSIQFTKWTTMPAPNNPNQFHLVLDVINQSFHEMTVQYGENLQQITLENKQSKRIAIAVNRFTVSQEECKDKKPSLAYARHLSDLVDIKWRILSEQKSGTACISGMNFTSFMVENMKPSPIQWEVKINDNLHFSNESLSFKIGTTISVCVDVCNNSGCLIGPVLLSVQPYMDYLNGVHEILNDALSIGQNNCRVEEIANESTIHHTCSFIFLSQGCFKLNISCQEIMEESHDLSSQSLIFNTKSDQVWNYRPIVVFDISQ